MIIDGLSVASKNLIVEYLDKTPAFYELLGVDGFDSGRAVITTSENIDVSAPGPRTAVHVDPLDHSDSIFGRRKKSMINALDEFEVVIDKVIQSRQQDEDRARQLVVIIGLGVLFAVLLSLVWPLFNGGQKVLLPILTSAGATAFAFVLYSPVPKILQIANDRSYLMMLPVSIKVRVLAASNVEELSIIGKELQMHLQSFSSHKNPAFADVRKPGV